MNKKKQNILVICGPTASGKTGLALQLAKELTKANILSVDSRQVYKDLSIITGKDVPDNLPEGIRIFGHDLFSSDETANLGDFIRYSQNIIKISQESNTPLIIVGGTGLYLKAITQDLNFVLIPPNQKLREELEKLSLQELQEKLKKENPNKFSSINHSDLMNPRRLIRYIEISQSNISPSKSIDNSKIEFHWVGLLPGKNFLKELICNRVIERIDGGAINEVKRLLKKYPDKTLPIYSSLGVSQIIEYLENHISMERLIEIWTKAEVDYARRQIVWFNKQPGILWYDKDIDRLKLSQQLFKIYQQIC